MSKLLMCVDDDDVFHEIVRRGCQKIPAVTDLLFALDGECALALLQARLTAGEKLPDLLLVDANMPVLDGFGFLRGFSELRARWPELERTRPIAMLTSSDQARDRELAFELGVHEYMVKGARVADVRGAIARLVE